MEQYITAADSVRLWVKTYGQKKDEACLFINGAGANSSSWSERPCSGLANDALSILNSLDIEQAQVIGQSMGGFITRILAIHYPQRIRMFTSISSSTNSPLVPPPPTRTWEFFMENRPTGYLERDLVGFLPVWEYLNGTAFFDKELAIDYTRRLYKRQDGIAEESKFSCINHTWRGRLPGG